MSLDDLLRQIEEDELQDGLELAREHPELVVLTPINYAKARGIRPQRVYAAIRNKKLSKELCACGRVIVNVAAADGYFGFNDKLGEEEEDDA